GRKPAEDQKEPAALTATRRIRWNRSSTTTPCQRIAAMKIAAAGGSAGERGYQLSFLPEKSLWLSCCSQGPAEDTYGRDRNSIQFGRPSFQPARMGGLPQSPLS